MSFLNIENTMFVKFDLILSSDIIVLKIGSMEFMYSI